MKFRKKPVVIEAVEWTGHNHREMFDFLTLGRKRDVSMEPCGENFEINFRKVKEGGLVIKTLEGEHIATIGDFIIKGVQGEFYPCKPNIFKATYEKACMERTSLTDARERVLKHLVKSYREDSEFCYSSFRGIMFGTNLDRQTVRNACRALARKGLTEYGRGLWSNDGMVAGSGYRITAAGEEFLISLSEE